VDGSINPVRDKEIIDIELQLKDLETVQSRIQKVEKQAKTGGDKEAKRTYDILVQFKEALEQGKSARTVNLIIKRMKNSERALSSYIQTCALCMQCR
jgi:Predicted GTPase, probable translation factor